MYVCMNDGAVVVVGVVVVGEEEERICERRAK